MKYGKYIWLTAFVITIVFTLTFLVSNTGTFGISIDTEMIVVIILIVFSFITLGMLIQTTYEE